MSNYEVMKKNIYLARQSNSDMYKIGISKKDPLLRLKELQTGNAIPLELVQQFETKHSFKMETALHSEFQSKRLEGEWFILSESDIKNFLLLCEEKEVTMDFLKKNNHFWND